MQTQVTKKIDFKGKELFIGLDVHKRSWSVTIVVDGIEHRTFTQPSDSLVLNNYLQRMFPGGDYNSAYEAGFCGYGIHLELNSLGIKNIVINAADIPTSQKDKLQKRDLRRSKNRIKSFLQYYGVSIPAEYDNNLWALKYVSWLKQIKMQTLSGQDALSNLIRSYEYHREQLLILSRQIRQRIREYDNELYSLLKSISGIGPLTSSALITELGDINRFSHIDHLSSFVGLIPRVRESGETIHTGGITFRCNSFLRTMLIETYGRQSGWILL